MCAAKSSHIFEGGDYLRVVSVRRNTVHNFVPSMGLDCAYVIETKVSI